MFMPTRADCTPISFCEAASYGLPVISTDTGGVAAVVEPGETGILLPLNASAEQYEFALYPIWVWRVEQSWFWLL